MFDVLDVDTIEELTKILIFDLCELVDLAADEGDVFEVGTFDVDLILGDGFVGPDSDAFWSCNNLVLLMTHEAVEIECTAILRACVLDWEVGVDEVHLITPAECNTGDHVLDDAEECADTGKELAVAEPAAGNDLVILLIVLEVKLEVGEILDELCCLLVLWILVLDCDNTRLNCALDVLWDLEMFLMKNWTRHWPKGRSNRLSPRLRLFYGLTFILILWF